MPRKSAARRKGGARGPADPAARALDAALRLAARRRWNDIALADIAGEAGLSLAELHTSFASRQAVLAAFARRVDTAVLESVAGDKPEGPARDRLFDVLMRRFDAMQGHRDALRSIAQGTALDPLSALCSGLRLERSMALMLEAAKIPTGGLAGLLRVKGLSGLYLWVLRVWLGDETTDRSRTMAVLDRRLKDTERLIDLCGSLCSGYRRPRASSKAAL